MNAGWGLWPRDFMKSTKFHPEIWWISPMKYGRFHPDFTCEIHPNYRSKCFSKKSSVWWMQGGGFHPWNPPDFTLKSGGFHRSNLGGDFTLKSGGFHPWNLADFTQISPVKSTQNYKSKCFSKNSSVWWMQGGGFHPWNPPDFTLKSGGFDLWNLVDLTQISPVKSTQNYKSKCFSKNSSVWWMHGGGFHPWNPADFTQISPVKSTQNYKSKCFSKKSSVWWMQGGGFHPRNLVDSTLKSGGFQPWNLVDFTQISPVKSTQNYKSKCFSKNSSVWWMQGGGYDQGFHEIHKILPWNLVDFTCEIQQSSPRFHLWNPPKIIKASVSAKTLQFDECKVGAMTKDFMKSAWNPLDFMWNPPDFMKSAGFHLKSGGFHVKSKDLLQGIVTLCFI